MPTKIVTEEFNQVNTQDLSSIKLVIWDLDDTLWNGTLSENGSSIKINKNNMDFIKILTDHGIMNSICSKNDYSLVQDVFIKNGFNEIWSYFVFPSINWEPKGARIKDIIKKMSLRAQQVLFIDDNKMNLEEAKFYCPEIKTAFPSVIAELMSQAQRLTKNDTEHSRLNQYKILENKNEQRKKYSSNEKFLYSSNIQVDINSDCQNHISRITELINRTNQLNYTKLRINETELQELLINPELDNRYITVTDNYGDYGICGFYSYNKQSKSLIHFLFSCRIMSMGVEQYVYSILNFPEYKLRGDVAVQLVKDKYCDWINQRKTNGDNKYNNQSNDIKNNYKILLKGPCDMTSIISFLKSNSSEFQIDEDKFVTEVDYYDDRGMRVYNSLRLVNIVNSKKLSEEIKNAILYDAEFMTRKVYEQSIFKEKYDVIVFSLLTDTYSVVYKHKKTGEIIAWDNYPNFTEEKYQDFYRTNKSFLSFEYNKPNDIWSEDKIKNYCKNFEHIGYMEPEQLINYLDYLIENVPKTTQWIFILGSDKKPKDSLYSSPHWKNAYKQRKKQIPAYLKYLKTKKNVTCIELSKIITSEDDSTDEPDHFSRFVYYKLSREIAKAINKSLKTDAILMEKSLKVDLKLFIDKINRITNTIFAPIHRLKQIIKKLYLLYKILR